LPLPEDAEDVASQVFLEALRTIDGYATRGKPLLAWLSNIARNLIAQRLRQRVREKRDEGVIDPTSASSGMSDEIIERLDLAKALTELTPDQQDVIVLRFFLVMSIKETSAILGKSDNAVAVLQVRAIAGLRRHLSAGTLKRLISAGGDAL
jgi:RNA polymerase sigma-70 factor (ECF subfamily)